MKQSTVRSLLAALLIGGHVAAIFLMFFRLGRYFETEEIVQVILIFTPLTGFYATAVVKYYAEIAEHPANQATLDFTLCSISIFLCVSFVFAIFYAILDFPEGVIKTKDGLKSTVAGIETALGVLLGIVVTKLFPAAGSSPRT